MKTKLLLSFFLLFFFDAFSQNVIEAYVYDKDTKQPLAFASVYLLKSEKGTITNDDGYFKLPIKYDIDTLVVRYVGYHQMKITVAKGGKLKIGLKSQITKLRKAVIVGYKEDKIYDIIIKASQLQRKVYKYSSKMSKSFARINTFCDNKMIEDFEAFYTTYINSIQLENNFFKNGKVKVEKNATHDFYSLGVFSKAIPDINLFSNIVVKSNSAVSLTDMINNSMEGVINIATSKQNLISPSQLYYKEELKSEYNIDIEVFTGDWLKLSFRKINDSSNIGYLIIDRRTHKYKEIFTSYFNKNKTITSINSNTTVDNQSTEIRVIYNGESYYNLPLYISLVYSFDYIKNEQNKQRIKIKALQYLYGLNKQFVSFFPKIQGLTNYELFYLVPTQEMLWDNEVPYVKTKLEDENNNKLLKLDIYSSISSNYQVVEKFEQVDKNKINRKVLKGKRKFDIETKILCDVYLSSKNSIKTEVVFDYAKSFYALDNLNYPNNNFLEDSLINRVIRASIVASNNLANTLRGREKLNERIIKKELKKAESKLNATKEQIYNDWYEEYRNNKKSK